MNGTFSIFLYERDIFSQIDLERVENGCIMIAFVVKRE